jgi:hypothetical protein
LTAPDADHGVPETTVRAICGQKENFMLPLRRSILCLALLGLVLGLASVAPAAAIEAPPLYVSVNGAGPTLSAATDAALYQIRQNYIILSYSTSNPLCSVIPTTGDPFCSIKVTARVFRRAVVFP